MTKATLPPCTDFIITAARLVRRPVSKKSATPLPPNGARLQKIFELATSVEEAYQPEAFKVALTALVQDEVVVLTAQVSEMTGGKIHVVASIGSSKERLLKTLPTQTHSDYVCWDMYTDGSHVTREDNVGTFLHVRQPMLYIIEDTLPPSVQRLVDRYRSRVTFESVLKSMQK